MKKKFAEDFTEPVRGSSPNRHHITLIPYQDRNNGSMTPGDGTRTE